MGGPTDQKTDTVFIPPGEGRQVFSPQPLAWLVENLEIGADGVLTSVVGPSVLRTDRQVFLTENFDYEGVQVDNNSITLTGDLPNGMFEDSFKSGIPQSVFSADLLNGGAHMILYRIGSRLYSFRGGYVDEDDILISDLAVSASPDVVDQYVVINDKIIFFNGIDRPQVITYDGRVTPLGFSRRAPSPAVSSPGQPIEDERMAYYPNSQGYSWKGRIGTPGDELTGTQASLLKGHWYYYAQYEDINGDLSEMSTPSEPATLFTTQADPFEGSSVAAFSGDDDNGEAFALFGKKGKRVTKNSIPDGTEIDDLTRRFLVKMSGDAPEHTVAVRLFRTNDTLHGDGVPRFLTRVPGSRQFFHDDNAADSELGFPWTETISVPLFKLACAHQGRLIIANTPGNPGVVRRSQPGFPGTFVREEFIFPDGNGDEITALASHGGQLLAFTKDSTYLIDQDFMQPVPLSTGIGCISPKSIKSFVDGSLIWLSHDGFYSLNPGNSLVKISTPIDKVFEDELNSTRFKYATAIVDPYSKEYRCCVATKGSWENRLMLCFDGTYWRRQTLGIHIADMCVLKDYTKLTLAVGSDPRERNVHFGGTDATVVKTGATTTVRSHADLSRLFVLNRQTTDYFGPSRRIRYRSNWLRSGEFGLVPTHVRTMYIGMMDAWSGRATIRFYRNGSWDPITELNDIILCGPDDGSGIVAEQAQNAVVGKAKTRNPRVFWRQIPVGIENANSWAFEIEIIGNPSPEPYEAEAMPELTESKSFDESERKIWQSLYRNDETGSAAYDLAKASPESWELGRMKIFGFAFDLSVATKGSPLGRVPHRKDQ